MLRLKIVYLFYLYDTIRWCIMHRLLHQKQGWVGYRCKVGWWVCRLVVGSVKRTRKRNKSSTGHVIGSRVWIPYTRIVRRRSRASCGRACPSDSRDNSRIDPTIQRGIPCETNCDNHRNTTLRFHAPESQINKWYNNGILLCWWYLWVPIAVWIHPWRSSSVVVYKIPADPIAVDP